MTGGESEGRVLLLADALNQGGAERQLSLLARWMPKEWSPTVWASSGGFFEGELRGWGVSVRVYEKLFPGDPLAMLDLATCIADEQPDVVHAWGWMSAMWALPACRISGTPLISGFVRMGTPPLHLRKGRLMMKVAGYGDRVIANSAAGLSSWGIPKNRGRVVPNGFDPHRLPRPGDRRERTGPFTVVMSANISPLKDHGTMTAALRLLLDRGFDVRFLALGDGPGMPALRRETADLLASGALVLPGRVPDVMPFLLEADAGLLLSSRGEGCSNSIMEYMAASLPTVCTGEGGNPELVTDGVTGFLVLPDAPEEVASRLEVLAGNGEMARDMGRRARLRLEEDYSVETMVRRTVEVYRELL